jgi:hypothetical protein
MYSRIGRVIILLVLDDTGKNFLTHFFLVRIHDDIQSLRFYEPIQGRQLKELIVVYNIGSGLKQKK